MQDEINALVPSRTAAVLLPFTQCHMWRVKGTLICKSCQHFFFHCIYSYCHKQEHKYINTQQMVSKTALKSMWMPWVRSLEVLTCISLNRIGKHVSMQKKKQWGKWVEAGAAWVQLKCPAEGKRQDPAQTATHSLSNNVFSQGIKINDMVYV